MLETESAKKGIDLDNWYWFKQWIQNIKSGVMSSGISPSEIRIPIHEIDNFIEMLERDSQ